MPAWSVLVRMIQILFDFCVLYTHFSLNERKATEYKSLTILRVIERQNQPQACISIELYFSKVKLQPAA